MAKVRVLLSGYINVTVKNQDDVDHMFNEACDYVLECVLTEPNMEKLRIDGAEIVEE